MMTTYECYEDGFIGKYTVDDLTEIYDKNIDEAEYPDFECWMTDMIRTGIFTESED